MQLHRGSAPSDGRRARPPGQHGIGMRPAGTESIRRPRRQSRDRRLLGRVAQWTPNCIPTGEPSVDPNRRSAGLFGGHRGEPAGSGFGDPRHRWPSRRRPGSRLPASPATAVHRTGSSGSGPPQRLQRLLSGPVQCASGVDRPGARRSRTRSPARPDRGEPRASSLHRVPGSTRGRLAHGRRRSREPQGSREMARS
jgi:hypothetical protein